MRPDSNHIGVRPHYGSSDSAIANPAQDRVRVSVFGSLAERRRRGSEQAKSRLWSRDWSAFGACLRARIGSFLPTLVAFAAAPCDDIDQIIAAVMVGNLSACSDVLDGPHRPGSFCDGANPLWVISRHRALLGLCPLYPRKRTFRSHSLSNSGSLAMLTAIRRASSKVNCLATTASLSVEPA